ncbi:hypothetical protein [Pseudomonas sp. BN102]|nr:hypothetical protein [Pseudomonas sp. BN102]
MSQSEILFLLEGSCASLAFLTANRKEKSAPIGHLLGHASAAAILPGAE